mgnify:CR=1 FL=1
MTPPPLDLLKPLIALLAIVNPIGAVPFFLAFTQGLNREQRLRTLRISAFSAFAVVTVSAVAVPWNSSCKVVTTVSVSQ